ncbi:DUF3987 domain-containing protein [Dyella flava]|uniref:DUF3987 domain-containing protein n=1 Tax=Dyella flava TaxID=1920170 RepID=A0ABS2K0Z1_9GAMM|nr:DUF3987 domain-containing protein [Dyella flava]MBM7124407.1 DUF3987 domain-containing protein [Dyella flava]
MPLSVNTLSITPTASGKGESYRKFFQAAIEIEVGQSTSPVNDMTIDDLLLQDVSPSALMAELDGHGKSASIQMEDAYSFLRSGLTKPDFISELPRAWSGPRSMKRGRHNRQKSASEACLTIGLRIQPDVLYPELKRDKGRSRSLGFWGRFLTFNCDPERFPVTPWQPVPSDISDYRTLMNRLHALLSTTNDSEQSEEPTRKVLTMDTGAHAHLRHIADWVKGQMLGQFHDIQDAAGRAAENTLRLASNFQVVCAGEGPISYDMIDRAWAFVYWSLTQYRQVFVLAMQPPPKPVKLEQSKPPKLLHHQKRLHEDMQFMLSSIAACSRPTINQWVCQQDVAHRMGFNKERFLKTLLWLVDEGHVELVGDEDNGMIRILPARPQHTFHTGPELLMPPSW